MENDDFVRIQDKRNEETAILGLEIHEATLEEYDLESPQRTVFILS